MRSKFVMQSKKKKKKGDQLLSHLILQFPLWLMEISHLQCIQNCVPVLPALGLARLHGRFFWHHVLSSVIHFFQLCLSFSTETLIFLSSTLSYGSHCFNVSYILSIPTTRCLYGLFGCAERDDEDTLEQISSSCFRLMVSV